MFALEFVFIQVIRIIRLDKELKVLLWGLIHYFLEGPFH